MVDYGRYTTLKIEKADRIATVSLNRPQSLNAIDMVMHRELEDIWLDLMADDEVHVAVLTGAGRCFSAGGNLKEMVEAYKTGKPYTTLHGARRLIMNILDMEKPVIAAVNGDAIGLPANILLFSDIIVAAEDARLGDPHVSRVGLVAGDSGAIVWPLLAGLNKAKELLLTGDLITAKEAERLGIINYALPREQVLPKAIEFARRLAFGPTRAIRWTKVCINKRLRDEVNLVLDASLGIEYAVTFWKEDHGEAIESFVEKRETQFKGVWP
ncbi:MAG: enoyl-CoA hydratase/isomerase family protein [Chloroflexi bacterium]|nr:enoyl-CoA hydratase/isomerase family protein [Chloroflexota bacterium]